MIESLYSNFKDVLLLSWPMVFVSMIILISFRLSYIYKNNLPVVLHKEILLFFFAFYVLCLFQIVTVNDTSSSGSSNFIPFKEILRYKTFSNLFIKNVIGNVLLFLPYGYFVGKFFSGKSKFLSFFLILLASCSIEFTQLYIGRVFDVDDIILNVLGGMLGYFCFLFLESIYDKLPKAIKNDIFLNIIFSIFFLLFLILIFMLML